jgi:hypothetical protein
VDFKTHQIEEVSDVRWMSLTQLRDVDPTLRLTNFARSVFNYVKKTDRVKRLETTPLKSTRPGSVRVLSRSPRPSSSNTSPRLPSPGRSGRPGFFR